jgi:NADH:ubiquinone reductase (H+-translocating)
MTSVVIVGSGFTGFECARQAVANPLKIQLSGYPAKFVARGYHLYAIPRAVRAVALAYLTDVLFARSLVSLGLSTQSDAEFSTSEGVPLPKTG